MKLKGKLLYEFTLNSEELRKAIWEAFKYQSCTEWPPLEEVEFDYRVVDEDPLGMKIEIEGTVKTRVES